jgi:peptide/nickel transport system permease protein
MKNNDSMSSKNKSNKEKDQSYWATVGRQFRKKKTAMVSFYITMFLAFVAITAPFLANEKPIFCKYEGKIYFPVVKQIGVDLGIGQFPQKLLNVKWKDLEYDFAIWPLIPYLPLNQDDRNTKSVSPLAEQDIKSTYWKHWFGTDELGRDVLSGMIHGTKTAFTVGIVSMFIASVIGIFFGSLAGFFGDTNLKMSRIRMWLNLLFFFFAMFYAFGVRSYILSDALSNGFASFLGQFLLSLAIFGAIIGFANLLTMPLKKIPFLAEQVAFPVDLLISRSMEVLVSIPTFFLILLVLAVIKKPNIYVIMVIIGFTSWTGIARYIRAELLRIRSLEYIEAAKALGYSNWRTMAKHAIPNALAPVLIAIAFGVASAILIESSLSFLGFGSGEDVTWGALLSSARQSPKAWWLAIFPGFAIFITVTIFNLMGEGLTDAMDPRLRK